MTPADEFYMNHKKECCDHDCDQGRDCPNREPWDLIGLGLATALVCAAGIVTFILTVVL